ncbi:3TM-type holin [Trinickia symbiotica]|uniref:Holin of 3TMs, for gene-transfer release n=1 Tax=Trinickia symbiotica TaxID=863227 RepID=A0A2N7X9N5_9BURK|nr:3TM-type holin [Trinickia symbiotica]PMS38463.1 hypothetical protein C0Z20_00835 [Trinickia symbiotica]
MGVVDSLLVPGSGVFGLLDDLVKRIWKDPAQQDAVRLQLLDMQQKGELAEFDGQLKVQLAQLQIDDDEAKNPRIFIAGARAFIEWVCGTGLAYQIVARPFLMWASAGWWHVPAPPTLDMGTLITLLGMLLGSGTLHLANKVLTK